jgi:hypothetical protein
MCKKIGDRRGNPQVARHVAEDQVQPSGELRLTHTGRDPWIVSSFSEKGRT